MRGRVFAPCELRRRVWELICRGDVDRPRRIARDQVALGSPLRSRDGACEGPGQQAPDGKRGCPPRRRRTGPSFNSPRASRCRAERRSERVLQVGRIQDLVGLNRRPLPQRTVWRPARKPKPFAIEFDEERIGVHANRIALGRIAERAVVGGGRLSQPLRRPSSTARIRSPAPPPRESRECCAHVPGSRDRRGRWEGPAQIESIDPEKVKGVGVGAGASAATAPLVTTSAHAARIDTSYGCFTAGNAALGTSLKLAVDPSAPSCRGSR